MLTFGMTSVFGLEYKVRKLAVLPVRKLLDIMTISFGKEKDAPIQSKLALTGLPEASPTKSWLLCQNMI